MDIGIKAINATIEQGKVITISDLAIFNGLNVIILAKDDFNRIAGSDSTRFQLEQALTEIETLKAGGQDEIRE